MLTWRGPFQEQYNFLEIKIKMYCNKEFGPLKNIAFLTSRKKLASHN